MPRPDLWRYCRRFQPLPSRDPMRGLGRRATVLSGQHVRHRRRARRGSDRHRRLHDRPPRPGGRPAEPHAGKRQTVTALLRVEGFEQEFCDQLMNALLTLAMTVMLVEPQVPRAGFCRRGGVPRPRAHWSTMASRQRPATITRCWNGIWALRSPRRGSAAHRRWLDQGRHAVSGTLVPGNRSKKILVPLAATGRMTYFP